MVSWYVIRFGNCRRMKVLASDTCLSVLVAVRSVFAMEGHYHAVMYSVCM